MTQTGVSLSPDSQKGLSTTTSTEKFEDESTLLFFSNLMVSRIDPESTLAIFFGNYLRTKTSTEIQPE